MTKFFHRLLIEAAGYLSMKHPSTSQKMKDLVSYQQWEVETWCKKRLTSRKQSKDQLKNLLSVLKEMGSTNVKAE